MLRTLLATTALVVFTAGTVAAETAGTPKVAQPGSNIRITEYMTLESEAARGYLASNLIGKEVHVSASDRSETVGEIDDIVIGEDGSIRSVIVGVGGFLGMGEKSVAVDFDRLTMEKNQDGNVLVFADVSRAELEKAEAYERPEWSTMAWGIVRSEEASEPLQNNDPMAQRRDTVAGAGATQQMADKQQAMATGQVDTASNKELWLAGKTKISYEKLPAERLIGADVVDNAFVRVGEIGDILLTSDGMIDAAVVDVGGFLEMGEKEVALGFEKIEIYRDEDGKLYVLTPVSEAALKNAKRYDEDSYDAQRGSMRVTIDG